MKILMINKFFYQKGGSEAYAFNLRKLLSEAGHRVIDFSMQDEKNEQSEYAEYFIKNIDFNKQSGLWGKIKTAGHLLFSPEAQKKLSALIEKTQPEVAHLHNINFQLTPAILFTLKKYKIPVVWTLHDYKLICPNYQLFTKGALCQSCKKYKYYNCVRYKCLKNSYSFSFLAMLEMYLHKIILNSYKIVDCFVAPSLFLKDLVISWGINKDKVKQLPYCLDLAQLTPGQGLGSGLLYFGRLAPEKGLKTLINAMAGLPGIKLTIAGTGSEKVELDQLVKEQNLANIEFVGYKKGQDLFNLIRQSKIVILPSVWYENYPVSIMEALALGKPVIASDLGGINELVMPNKTGLLFTAGSVTELQKKIKQLNSNDQMCQAMGQQARSFIEQIVEPKNYLNNIISLYQSVLKK